MQERRERVAAVVRGHRGRGARVPVRRDMRGERRELPRHGMHEAHEACLRVTRRRKDMLHLITDHQGVFEQHGSEGYRRQRLRHAERVRHIDARLRIAQEPSHVCGNERRRRRRERHDGVVHGHERTRRGARHVLHRVREVLGTKTHLRGQRRRQGARRCRDSTRRRRAMQQLGLQDLDGLRIQRLGGVGEVGPQRARIGLLITQVARAPHEGHEVRDGLGVSTDLQGMLVRARADPCA